MRIARGAAPDQLGPPRYRPTSRPCLLWVVWVCRVLLVATIALVIVFAFAGPSRWFLVMLSLLASQLIVHVRTEPPPSPGVATT